MQNKLDQLKRILDESTYTVALCGSGMMEEGGFLGIKRQEKAYDIEKRYGVSPEYLFTCAYFETRPERFFDFYRNELLKEIPGVTDSGRSLAALEKAGKLQCIITSNIFELNQRGGCKNVINLHGSVYQNKCSHCGKEYSMEYIRDSKSIPRCEECNSVIRPLVNLFGEMLDSQLMTKTTEEISKADTLLVLGTTLESEVFKQYIRYFEGRNLVLIHKHAHYTDRNADLVFWEDPKNVLVHMVEAAEEKKEVEEKDEVEEKKEEMQE
ncbi:MAG: SIR2 family NAD-dependent protein deacylase [Lachnospiraceae bacterium]